MNWEAYAYAVVITVTMCMSAWLVFLLRKPLAMIGLVFMVIPCAAVFTEMWSSGESFAVLKTTLMFTTGVCIFLIGMVLSHIRWWERKAKVAHKLRRATDMTIPMPREE